LAEHGSAPGPALQELIIKVKKAAGTALEQGDPSLLASRGAALGLAKV
jgi:hypothetical protein